EAMLAQVLERRVDALGDELLAGGAGGLAQPCARAERLPELREELVRELAAIARVEAGTRLLERLGTEAPPREGAERARRLVAEGPGAAGIGAGRRRRCTRVVENLGRLDRVDGLTQRRVWANRELLLRGLRDLGDQRTRSELALAAAHCVAHHDLF